MRGYNLTSAFHQIRVVQTALKSSIRPTFSSSRAMSSITTDQDVSRIVSYWFEGEDPAKKWFLGGPAVDAEVKERFGDLVERARTEELDKWTEQPKSTLALLILLDQFPRNLYRNSPLSFSSDKKALKVATRGIAKGFDRQLPEIQQNFFYLPMMHDETLLSQVASVAHYEAFAARCDAEIAENQKKSFAFAKSHMYCILNFGRFPSRNAVLGRDSTTEEIAYLQEHPSGF